MSYAVIELSGRQFLVTEGSKLKIDRLDEPLGKTFSLTPLLVGGEGTVVVGHPEVATAKVKLEVLEEARDKKVEIRRFKSKSRHLRRRGHRQPISIVVVSEILTAVARGKAKIVTDEAKSEMVAGGLAGLDLSTRVKNVLIKGGITKTADLKPLGKEKLLEIDGIGEKAAAEILAALKKSNG